MCGMGVLEKVPPFYLGPARYAHVQESHIDVIQKMNEKCQVRSITGLKIEDGI
jgi:hypothetical protein